MTEFDDEMMAALEKDGEILRQLTGEDHGPIFFHQIKVPEPCDHDFTGWRAFDGGLGGEQVCSKCGIGAMAHTLSLDLDFGERNK